MAARESRTPRDVIGFTRIFVFFCALVLLPALLLSGFGVIAILNERQADKQRRREGAEEALRTAEQDFIGVLDRSDRAVRTLLDAAKDDVAQIARARADGHPIGRYVVFDAEGAVDGGESPFRDSLAAHLFGLSSSAALEKPAHVRLDEQGFAAVVSLQRLGRGRAVVYALDDQRLEAALAGLHPASPLRRLLRVNDGTDAPVVGALERLMQDLIDAKDGTQREALADAREDTQIVERRLNAPFDRYTIAIVATPSLASTRTMVVYIVLLVVFLATLITGVVLTARLIYQETRLSRMKTDFVSHVSHELRTPLTSIRMFIETLQLGRAHGPEEQQECLDLLAKETERLSEMIERVLGYARLQAGRRLFQREDVSVEHVVDDAIEAFRAQLVGRAASDSANGTKGSLRLEKAISDGLPRVHVDRQALVEALLNLLANAYKYTGPDKEIVVFARPSRRGHVAVGVRDNGPGLAKNEQKRVWERFYQSGSLLSKKAPGSGLGLAITRAIVEGNGGSVHVESELGKGATFILELQGQDANQSNATSHA